MNIQEGKSQNFEWKACLENAGHLKENWIQAYGDPKHVKQVDYFYNSSIQNMRQKIRIQKTIPPVHRELDKSEDCYMMINYSRNNQKEARASDFEIKLMTEDEFKNWKKSCGTIWMIVEKERYLWILEHEGTKMRLHYDQIKNLNGLYIEFELMHSDQLTKEKSQEIINYWIDKLGLKDAKPVENAYADMLLDRQIDRQQTCGIIMFIIICVLMASYFFLNWLKF
jgi:adenylate cyclase class IV